MWAAVVAIGLAVAASWLVPIDFNPASRQGQVTNTAVFVVRVFQFHAGLACAAIVPIAWLLRRRRLLVAALIVSAPILLAEAWRATPSAREVDPNRPTLRVAAVNLWFRNQDLDDVEGWLRQLDADVVTFAELGNHQIELARRLGDLYPHQFPALPRRVSQAIFSKRPLRAGVYGDGRVSARVAFDGKPLLVSCVHHRSPGGVDTVARNFSQASALVREAWLLKRDGLQGVYLGDFNAAEWTPQIQAIQRAGLTEAHDAAAWGRGPTWPSDPWNGQMFGWHINLIDQLRLGTRIDHVFTTGGLAATDAGVSPRIGSDHRAVWADLQRTRDAAP